MRATVSLSGLSRTESLQLTELGGQRNQVLLHLVSSVQTQISLLPATDHRTDISLAQHV